MADWEGRQTDSLRTTLTSATALVPMMQASPLRAAELILKATLRTPLAHDWLDIDGGELGIVDDHKIFDALPQTGPMLAFFANAPETAADTLLRIVTHATDAWSTSTWADVDDQDLGANFEILLDNQWVTLVGNSNVMHWHRGDARVPRLLASSLMALERHLYNELDAERPVDQLLLALQQSRSVAIFGLLVDVACYRPSLLEGSLACLATSAGLILSDRLYKRSNARMPFLAGFLTDSQRRAHQVWHDMPHRSASLERQIMPLVIEGGPMNDLVAAAREHWLGHPERRWRFIEAQMDPANYTAVDIEPGVQGWLLAMPDDLRERIDADEDALIAAQWWLSAPQKLAAFLAQERELTDDEARRLFDDVHQRVTNEQPPGDMAGILAREDVTCGTAAVLLSRARDWVQTQPDVRAFCRTALIEPFVSVPATHAFDTPDAIVDWSWDGYAALAVPILWKDDPNDRELREVALRLATHPHRNTVRRFFAELDSIVELGRDVQRLDTIALRWSRWAAWQREHRRRQANEHNWGPDAPKAADLPDLGPNIESMFGAFVDGTLEPGMPDIVEFLADTPAAMFPAPATGMRRVAYSIDLAYLLAAWSHLFVGMDAQPDLERTRRLRIAEQLAAVLAAAWADRQGRRDGAPSKEERWLLECLAVITSSAGPDETRAIWQPILQAGDAAHDSVESFLNHLWSHTLRLAPTPSKFALLVNEMMSFTADLDSWNGWGHDHLELSLLCLDRMGHPRMTEQHVALLAALQPEWSRRVRLQVLGDDYAAQLVVSFLATPAAAALVDDALAWVAETMASTEHSRQRLEGRVADLLVTLANRDNAVFSRNSSAADLLSNMVQRQNAVALELASRLGRR